MTTLRGGGGSCLPFFIVFVCEKGMRNVIFFEISKIISEKLACSQNNVYVVSMTCRQKFHF